MVRIPSVALLVAFVLFGSGCNRLSLPEVAPPSPATTPAPVKPKTYTRAEFDALVLGKTRAEVIRAVGRPDLTMGSGKRVTDPEMWFYGREKHLVIMDPVSGKRDASAQVVFEHGKDRVEEVNH